MAKPAFDKDRLKALTFAAGLSIGNRAAIATGAVDTMNRPVERKEQKILNQVGLAKDGGISKHLTTLEQRQRSNRVTWVEVPTDPAESGLIDLAMQLDPSQEEAIQTLVDNRYSCLIGAAGTGKTTLVKRVVAQFIYGLNGAEELGLRMLDGRQGPSIAIVAFTGKATAVLKENLPSWLHPAVKTIHGLLEYAPVTEGSGMFYPTRNAENPLGHDLIVIDESSMVGLDLWHNLIDACTSETRIILMGDLNQLTPVGDAPFFAHVLAACLDEKHDWRVAELTKVHRQKGIGGQRVLDTAYAILDGKVPDFDTVEVGKPWRVAGIQLPAKTEDAHNVIVRTLFGLQRMRPHLEDGTEDSRAIYSPYDDLVLTAGNGDEDGQKGAAVQQSPINESLSRLLLPETPDHPVYLIDGGRVVRQFSVGDRVMCRRNESPGTENRVTNGMTGRIMDIVWNPLWNGDRTRFGTRNEVLMFQHQKLAEFRGEAVDPAAMNALHDALDSIASMDVSDVEVKDERRGQPSSHKVTVAFENGAVRTYDTATGVEGIQLAYAMTTHKAQGSQADTVFIVVHSSVKHQLSIEWFYTAVTRAKQRLVIFYNDLGIRTACSRRQIYGRTLAEKIQRYQAMVEKGDKIVRFYPGL